MIKESKSLIYCVEKKEKVIIVTELTHLIKKYFDNNRIKSGGSNPFHLFYMIFIVFLRWVSGDYFLRFFRFLKEDNKGFLLIFLLFKKMPKKRKILNKEIILWGLFFLIYLTGTLILVFKYDFKIKMLPKCAGQGFYVYYDNEDKMCKCYSGYGRIEGKIGCFKD